MKRLFFVFILFAVACVREPGEMKTGDLVFVGIPADYSLDETSIDGAIGAATGDGALNIIHVAIVDVDSAGVWIIDATIKRGVDRHPLDTFLCDFTLKDGSLPVLMLMRPGCGIDAEAGAANARQYLGKPYDECFLPGNDAYYCSELVQCSYLDSSGKPVFKSAPMNFKNDEGEFPLYWQQLFARLGQPIPQDVPGTNPQAMYRDKRLKPCGVLPVMRRGGDAPEAT